VRNITFQFQVAGDSYEELVSKSETILNRFLNPMSSEDFEEDYSSSVRVNYDMVVSSTESISSEYEFYADVVAKIRNK